jgi:hypothetical protein
MGGLPGLENLSVQDLHLDLLAKARNQNLDDVARHVRTAMVQVLDELLPSSTW